MRERGSRRYRKLESRAGFVTKSLKKPRAEPPVTAQSALLAVLFAAWHQTVLAYITTDWGWTGLVRASNRRYSIFQMGNSNTSKRVSSEPFTAGPLHTLVSLCASAKPGNLDAYDAAEVPPSYWRDAFYRIACAIKQQFEEDCEPGANQSLHELEKQGCICNQALDEERKRVDYSSHPRLVYACAPNHKGIVSLVTFLAGSDSTGTLSLQPPSVHSVYAHA